VVDRFVLGDRDGFAGADLVVRIAGLGRDDGDRRQDEERAGRQGEEQASMAGQRRGSTRRD
jgi:hypothetical protein